MPCNVLVQESPEGSGIDVSFADPRAMFEMVGTAGREEIAGEADRRLRAVLEALTG